MALSRTWRRRILVGVTTLVVTGAAVGVLAWYKLFREVEQERFADPNNAVARLVSAGMTQSDAQRAFDESRFKYGSIGVEKGAGLPYWIWLVLPRVFPEYLPGPGGLASFGFIWEPGEELPVGFSKSTIGFPRVGVTCAACHTSSYREHEGGEERVVVAGPSHTVNFQAYVTFLTKCANDPRFNAGTILSEIDQAYDLGILDRQIYKYLIIPETGKKLRAALADIAWINEPGRPAWGPGRVDAFIPIERAVLSRFGDGKIATSDMPPIWNLGVRAGLVEPFHWDALNTEVHELVIFSASGAGALPESLPMKNLNWVEDFIQALPPPKYPFAIDERLAASGATVFKTNCAECHTHDGVRAGHVMPQSEVGTDANRLSVWTDALADHYNHVGHEYEWGGFSHFQHRNGYVNMLLDGVWLRAPYLHNGSVPSLRALLTAPGERPRTFVRGYDVYDPAGVGFVSEGVSAARAGFHYDTTLKGNGNSGHSYGTQLSENEKVALIEYLKGI